MIFDAAWREDKRAEKAIRSVLWQLSRQRVAIETLSIQTDRDPWRIRNGLPGDPATMAALTTCYVRGWVDSAEEKVMGEKFAETFNQAILRIVRARGESSRLSAGSIHWRLTDSGWGVIERRRMYDFAGLALALLSVPAIGTLAGYARALWPHLVALWAALWAG